MPDVPDVRLKGVGGTRINDERKSMGPLQFRGSLFQNAVSFQSQGPRTIVESGPSCCLWGDRLVRLRSKMDLGRVI
jgi:hypothetical protein